MQLRRAGRVLRFTEHPDSANAFYFRMWHFSDIDAAWFNVRFRALFRHQRMARLCRRMTQSRHSLPCFLLRTLRFTKAMTDLFLKDGQ